MNQPKRKVWSPVDVELDDAQQKFLVFWNWWFDQTDGWSFPGEAMFLFDCARAVRSDKTIVEIGTYQGLTTGALAFGSYLGNRARVLTYDPHITYEERGKPKYGPSDLQRYWDSFSKLPGGVQGMVAHLIMSSSEGIDCKERYGLSCGCVDLLFIDGNHEYTSVANDLKLWAPLVADDGLILLHDTHESGPGWICTAFSLYPNNDERRELQSLGVYSLGKRNTIGVLAKMRGHGALSRWPIWQTHLSLAVGSLPGYGDFLAI